MHRERKMAVGSGAAGSVTVFMLWAGGCLVLLAAIVISWANNPFDWWVPRSEGYTRSVFLETQEGEPIQDVIERLGEPIVVRGYTDFECKQCRAYYFLAGTKSPWWVASFREAIVVVGKDERVLKRYYHDE